VIGRVFLPEEERASEIGIPSSFTLIALLLVGVALVACRLPAPRPTKVDQMIAPRNES